MMRLGFKRVMHSPRLPCIHCGQIFPVTESHYTSRDGNIVCDLQDDNSR
jgi:hypothetical protein